MANDLGKSQSEVWKKTQVIFSDGKTEPIEEISQKKVEFTVFLQVGTIMIIWLDDNLTWW